MVEDAPQSETAAPLVSLPPDSQPPAAEKKPLRKDTGKAPVVVVVVVGAPPLPTTPLTYSFRTHPFY